jgi:HEAT repeat protein
MLRRLSLALLLLGLAVACRSKPAEPNVAQLLEQLKSPDGQVSGKASLDLIRLGEPAAGALGEMLSDPDVHWRETAAQTLWGMGARGGAAAPALAAALSDKEPTVRLAVAMALANMGPAAEPAIPALVKALRDRDGQVRQWAARALGGIGPAARAAIPALERAAKTDAVHEPAEEAIQKIRGQ